MTMPCSPAKTRPRNISNSVSAVNRNAVLNVFPMEHFLCFIGCAAPRADASLDLDRAALRCLGRNGRLIRGMLPTAVMLSWWVEDPEVAQRKVDASSDG